ncbi:MAG TPA: LLM class F420-dependent oxidoreductase [Chloroflexi bacterium]|jgi:alkanesulfonate monooxygenase SsuD/methylene tetrahydromethanopterin reductase-like flavin-dependent oxidoreductase (luciferase family)|nr:LLM class F420-dependent oxidoreductase [Chloroflexota bacterium]
MLAGNVRFDMFLWQVVPWQVMRDDVRYVETLDIGTVWIGDRYLMPAEYGGPVLEAWTTLSALALCTERVRLGTMVSDVSLRHPAMLAKQAATVDCISGGRLDLGVGPGDNIAEEITALGLPSLPGDARVERLREAVEVIDALLRGEQVTYQGTYFQLNEAPLAPAPVQQPRPALTIAAQGKKGLRVVAERADVWVSALWARTPDEGVESIRERTRMLDEHCDELGRDPGTIERACFIGWSDSETPFASREAFRDFVGRYRDAGVQRFVFSLGGPETPDPYSKWVASGAWTDRGSMDQFAAQEMKEIQRSS